MRELCNFYSDQMGSNWIEIRDPRVELPFPILSLSLREGTEPHGRRIQRLGREHGFDGYKQRIQVFKIGRQPHLQQQHVQNYTSHTLMWESHSQSPCCSESRNGVSRWKWNHKSAHGQEVKVVEKKIKQIEQPIPVIVYYLQCRIGSTFRPPIKPFRLKTSLFPPLTAIWHNSKVLERRHDRQGACPKVLLWPM